MNSREKRNIFKEAFKEKLFNNGFKYVKNEFIRIHPRNVILVVAIDLTPKGRTFVTFDALPMCCDFSETDFRFNRRRMDSFCNAYTPDPDYIEEDARLGLPDNFSNFSIQYYTFFDSIFDYLNSVRDIRTAYEFMQWIPYHNLIYLSNKHLIKDNPHRFAYSSIYLKEWDEALSFLEELVHNLDASITRNNRDLANTKPGKRDEENRNMIKFSLARSINEKANWEKLIHLIHQNEYAELQDIVERNIFQWDSYCRDRWPMFYAK